MLCVIVLSLPRLLSSPTELTAHLKDPRGFGLSPHQAPKILPAAFQALWGFTPTIPPLLIPPAAPLERVLADLSLSQGEGHDFSSSGSAASPTSLSFGSGAQTFVQVGFCFSHHL